MVAFEVRNLAQRCAQAAKSTATLIDESIAKSNDGRVKVDQVATTIRAVTEESAKVKILVDEVNLDARHRGDRQSDHPDGTHTQITAANAEESAAAPEEASLEEQFKEV